MLEQLLLQGTTGLAAAVIGVFFGLLILWIIVSIPVWIAAKILTVGRAKFTRAMLVTAAGPVIYAVVFFISSVILSLTIGERFIATGLSFILAFIAWIWVFKEGFDTGWLRAIGIAFLATIVFVVLGMVVTLALQAVIPEAPPITPLPTF